MGRDSANMYSLLCAFNHLNSFSFLFPGNMSREASLPPHETPPPPIRSEELRREKRRFMNYTYVHHMKKTTSQNPDSHTAGTGHEKLV